MTDDIIESNEGEPEMARKSYRIKTSRGPVVEKLHGGQQKVGVGGTGSEPMGGGGEKAEGGDEGRRSGGPRGNGEGALNARPRAKGEVHCKSGFI